MRYRYKFKNASKNEQNGDKQTGISKKSRMLLLLLWSAVALGLYLGFSRVFALATMQVIEAFLFAGLVLYWVFAFRIRKIIKTKGEDAPEIPKLEEKGKYCLIFVLPLIFILIYDFIVTVVKSFVL